MMCGRGDHTGALAIRRGWLPLLRFHYHCPTLLLPTLRPNVRLDLPTDVNRYNAMLPTHAHVRI